MLNDYKIIKEIFAENSSTGRTENPIMVEFGGGGNFGKKRYSNSKENQMYFKNYLFLIFKFKLARRHHV